MSFVLLFVFTRLAMTIASGARVEVQANGALSIASQGTLNIGGSDSELAAKVAALEAQMENVMKTIAMITPPSSPPPSLPPSLPPRPPPPSPPIVELSRGIVPTGSSDSQRWGTYSGASDGDSSTRWHSADGDYLDGAHLAIDLGAPKTITSMRLITGKGSLNYAFKSLKISRATDDSTWVTVRTDGPYQCSAERETEHAGWPEPTRYVKIDLQNICAGGHFALQSWDILGY